MRLWHKDLIPVLPKKQLLGQWRECCLIAKGLSEGTLNHLLVNKVKEYHIGYFEAYSALVYNEMRRRGYKVNTKKFYKYIPKFEPILVTYDELYEDWHNERYLRQCYYNLEEKHDCGGITDKEWELIKNKFDEVFWDKYFIFNCL